MTEADKTYAPGDLEDSFAEYFQHLYGDKQLEQCLNRLSKLLNEYQHEIYEHHGKNNEGWTEKDSVLITYGDVLRDINRASEPRLTLLEEFLDTYIGDTISSLHLLPFFPSSSDDGFSVIDYKKVREDLGDWSHIEYLGEKYKVMADLVINHASRYNEWFRNFKKGKSPGEDYFIEVDPDMDLSDVVRPRNSPLLSPVKTVEGEKCVWTTFSADQVDLDFSNPDVLFEFIDIFLYYLSKGVKIIRLDAIAYLWKKAGTKSIHLSETHRVVKLFREIGDFAAPEVTIITETNVPHSENITYFGEGDEAHMIYQFSLPPLLLHALLKENAKYLTRWASKLPSTPTGCYYLNFTASHDGIGVRPLEGLVPNEEIGYMLDEVRKRGGFISYKKNPDGTQDPYELNITYFDAFRDPQDEESKHQVSRFLCSQIIKLAFKGIPGIYFHNLTATRNNTGEALSSGHKRAINRKQWDFETLTNCLEDDSTITHKILNSMIKLLSIRNKHPAFHPDGKQVVLDLCDEVFALKRKSIDRDEIIISVSNVTADTVRVNAEGFKLDHKPADGFRNLLEDGDSLMRAAGGELVLNPFESVWLLVQE